MCKVGKINDAKELFSSLFEIGLQPDVYVYNAIMKGLCQQGLMDEAYKVFKDMEKVGCLPNNCCYNIIIQGFLKHEDLPKASELINEMVDKGFSADAATTELIVHLSLNNDLILSKLRNRSEASKGVQ
ncbi:putative pentatricopeptide repeat-containing protein At1g12700, mitochondrial [Manihot esculenta]|nr:putative pentatricopeptide repeat-containing protein At1g12700, mitochondrial [Manihot esculenta]